MRPLLKIGGTYYYGDEDTPVSAASAASAGSGGQFLTSAYRWDQNPATSTNWTSASIGTIQGFGYRAHTQSAGCTAHISQCYMQIDWYPIRPVMGIHIYKNAELHESAYYPVMNAGTTTNQTVGILSVVYLSAGAYISIVATKTLEDDYIISGPAYSYLSIHRLAGNCL